MQSAERQPSRLTRLGRAIGDLFARAPSPETKASATAPLIALDGNRQPVWAPRDYASFAREGLMRNPVAFRAVRMIAEAAASVPLLLYDRDVEVDDHWLLDVVARPAPGQIDVDLKEAIFSSLLVAGNAYVEAVATTDGIRELHSLRADRVQVIPGADGWREAYAYTAAGQTVRIAGEVVPGVPRVLHLRFYHPLDDHYGLSPIEAAATAIDIHNEAARWNKALLDNSARPSGALVYGAGQSMSPAQFERLKKELEESFQGARNAGRPLLLEGGLDWKSMSFSPRDMDFIALKQMAAREIALALGVPPLLLGLPGDNTYSNYQEANRTFWRQTVIPLSSRVAKALSAWLGQGLELRCDLDALDALAPDREALWARLDGASFLTQDEKRAAAGYGPVGAAGNDAKFNPHHDAAGRFTFGPESGTAPDGTPVEPAADRQGYPIDIRDEETRGGHTIDRHVGKSEAYLKARISGSRTNIARVFSIGRARAGSFPSLEAANKLVNSTIADNVPTVQAFTNAAFPYTLPVLYVFKTFNTATGYEAYAPNDRVSPIMQTTYGVTVRLVRDAGNPKGYYVHSAWPHNED